MSTIRASDTGISRKTERFCQLLVCHRCRRSRAWELTLALITIKPTKLDLLEARGASQDLDVHVSQLRDWVKKLLHVVVDRPQSRAAAVMKSFAASFGSANV